MAKLYMIAAHVFVSPRLWGQAGHQRVVKDNERNFFYSDSTGVTASYIAYFGDRFNVPRLVTIGGKLITPPYLEGKTAVFNFWFVGCRPCVAEIPALNKLVSS